MNDLFSSHLEESYISSSTTEHRKGYAQFFTPYKIAQFMAAWVLGGNREIKSILDPAVGLGVFIRAIHEYLSTSPVADFDKAQKPPPVLAEIKIRGYDRDLQILNLAQRELSKLDYPENIELLGLDYLFHDWEWSYDSIIGNPPYFRFQDFATRNLALGELSDRLGIKLTGFTNIYALFLLKSIHQLKENGRCAYIIPSEFLNSNYGKSVKKYLLKHKSLRYIIIFDFQENIFDRAITTSSIFLFSHDDQTPTLEFINISCLQDLDSLGQKLKLYPEQYNTKVIPYISIDANIKWRGYYQDVNSPKYHNLIDFSTYAKVCRGIATGANSYFLFTAEKAQQLQISEQYLLPVVSKASQVAKNFFTEKDFRNLAIKNKPVFLLNAHSLEDSQVKKYILHGESLNIQNKYLTRHRNPWYALERRLPAPLWVSVFSRSGIKFIRNEAAVRNLTTFHCVYLQPLAWDKIDLLFAYLLTDIAKDIFTDNRREYGDGLEKFEPNDLNYAKVINLDQVPTSAVTEILYCYSEYRKSSLINQENQDLLRRLNDIFRDILA
jgi:adenine-specific DNA-methyltransferase